MIPCRDAVRAHNLYNRAAKDQEQGPPCQSGHGATE